jgi:hypothetical protein
MYELKKIGKVFTSQFVGTGPSSYKKIIYWAAVSQRLRNTGLDGQKHFTMLPLDSQYFFMSLHLHFYVIVPYKPTKCTPSKLIF